MTIDKGKIIFMQQTNLFEFLNEKFRIDKPIRLIELFAGIGSQAMALRDLGVEFKHHKVVEFDKYAIKSYNAIHGTNFTTSDIREIHAKDLDVVGKEKYCYVLTYSFPCQDLSKAGKQRGMSKGSNTRSGLLWEVERILDELNCLDQLPQVLLMENVPDVIGSKNINDFNMWQAKLEQLGYSNYVNVLNAKDFGISQNRARCFMVSILGEYYYEFPKGMPLKFKLKDFLEKEVDEKYYLSEKQIKSIHDTKFESMSIDRVKDVNGVCNTINTMQGGNRQPCIMIPDVFNPYHAKEVKDEAKEPRLYSQAFKTVSGSETEYGDTIDAFNQKVNKSGISPTITTRPDGFKTAILIPEKQRLSTSLICDKEPKIAYSLASREFKTTGFKDISPSICARDYKDPKVVAEQNSLRIRKLTPLECWRLMGFNDEDFYKAKEVNSNTQLYKQAGNSIVKQVLMAIFKNLI